MSKCECLKVAPLGDGTWACIMGDCRRKFEPQKPSGMSPPIQAHYTQYWRLVDLQRVGKP